MPATAVAAPVPREVPGPQLVVSASRLKTLQACERKYTGHYLFGLKEESGPAAQFGGDFHTAAEIFQTTGVVPAPESTIGKLLRSGSHFLRKPGSGALIEAEHRGELPDGTEYVAYVDASDAPPGGHGVLRLDDQKTTSDAKRALTDATILTDLQAMFYAWVVTTPHIYRLQEDSPWLEWDPSGFRDVALFWNYFLTRGSPKAWQVRGAVGPKAARAYLDAIVMPLVARARVIHAAYDAGVLTELNHADNDINGCGGVGTWCGSKDECDFNAGGLVQLRPNNRKKEPMGLAELRAKYGQKNIANTPAAVEPVVAPAEEAPAPVEVAPVVADPEPAVVAKRTRRVAPPAAPPAPAGDTINPPEALAALAAIATEVANDNARADQADADAEPTTDQLVDALIARGYTVTITKAAA